MHLTAIPEIEPEVIVPRPENKSDIKFGTDFVRGRWWRVFPEDGKDVRFIEWLIHHEEKFAPANGDGILISNSAFDKLLGREPK